MTVRLITRDDIEFSPSEVSRLLAQGGILVQSAGRTYLVPRLQGGKGADTSTLKNVSNWQTSTAQDQLSGASALESQAKSLYGIPIDYYSALASGDRSKMVSAAAPTLTELSKQYKAAKETINLGPSGVAQDYALMNLPAQQAGATAAALNQGYTSSFDKLTDLGSQIANWSVNKTGAAARFGEAGSSTAASAAEAQNKKKSATMGLTGNLAGTVGNILTGGLFGNKSSGSQG
jgi:hypothetical protein